MINDGSETTGQRLFRWFLRPLLGRVWYIGNPVVLMLQATPVACLKALHTATKPKVNQLHFRNLYANGRRYYLHPYKLGFQMTTTRSVAWNYRRRTVSTTILNAKLITHDNGITQIYLQSRMNLSYLLTSLSLWMPIFVASWLIYTLWNPILIGVLITSLFGLSWTGHRLTAVLDADALVWFIQKVLEEFAPAEIPALADENAPSDVIYEHHNFEQEWAKFYETHQPED